MYLADSLRVLLRRWKVVLAGVVALIAASVAIIQYVPTQYQASGQLLLVLPADATGKKTPTNPFLNLQSGLATVASLASGSVTTQDASRRMVADGYTSSYSVAVNPGTGPLIVVTAKDSDPAEAIKTRDAVIQSIDTDLAQLQNGVDVPATQVITARPVSVEATAEVLPGSKLRALAVTGIGLGLLTLMVVFGWEGLARRRQAMAAAKDTPPPPNVSELRSTNGVSAKAAETAKVPVKSLKRRTRRQGR